MNRHFYKLKIPVYKQPLRTIQDRNRFQSWILYCWFWGIKNSQFDKPASSVYRRLEAPCNIAVPANNIGSTDSVIWRPREGPFRPARCWLQGSARRLPKRRAEMKLSALLTEGALYHLSSNFWVRGRGMPDRLQPCKRASRNNLGKQEFMLFMNKSELLL